MCVCSEELFAREVKTDYRTLIEQRILYIYIYIYIYILKRARMNDFDTKWDIFNMGFCLFKQPWSCWFFFTFLEFLLISPYELCCWKTFSGTYKKLKNIILFVDYIKFDHQTFDYYIYFVLNIYFSISSLKI